MDYTLLTEADRAAMLERIGAASVEDLLRCVPEAVRLKRPLNLPAAADEMTLRGEARRMADDNAAGAVCFLGAGAYDHFIPATVDHLAARGEFVTAYTPYQAEASQGALQAFFEYQTLLCELTGMEVANASLYDGATAAAEAALMCRAVTGRNRIVVAGSVHPDTMAVLRTYSGRLGVEVAATDVVAGVASGQQLAEALDDATACAVVQTPNFLGCLEPTGKIAEVCRAAGVMLVVSVDPISLGILKRPGDYGADVAVGEGQAMGIPMSFGGPYLGFFAARRQLARRLPGRLVGQTTDAEGRRAWCLTLQTREQHIRRERATSNICTNQGLCALRAAIYLATMGSRGLGQVARLCLAKSHYAAEQIAALPGYALKFKAPFFKEFVVRTSRGVEAVLEAALQEGVLAGVPLRPYFPELGDCFLVAVTEKRTAEQIDRLVEVLGKVGR
jgi:glycine dehydrogenase subunit 1